MGALGPVEAFNLHPLVGLKIFIVLEEVDDALNQDVGQVLVVLDLLVIAGELGVRDSDDFLVLPLAAVVLERAPALGWTTIGAFLVGNLRVAAQLPIAPFGRVALGASVLLAIATTAMALLAPGATGSLDRTRPASQAS